MPQDSDPRAEVWDVTSRGFIHPPPDEYLHASRPLILFSRHRAVERFDSSERFGYDASNHRADVWRPPPMSQCRDDIFFNDAPHDFMSALDAGALPSRAHCCNRLCSHSCSTTHSHHFPDAFSDGSDGDVSHRRVSEFERLCKSVTLLWQQHAHGSAYHQPLRRFSRH